jgi:hypothetical protein
VTTFYFAITDLDHKFDPDCGFELPDVISAISYAQETLSDMALDGIPTTHGAYQAVTILGPEKNPIAVVSLRLSIDYCADPEQETSPASLERDV